MLDTAAVGGPASSVTSKAGHSRVQLGAVVDGWLRSARSIRRRSCAVIEEWCATRGWHPRELGGLPKAAPFVHSTPGSSPSSAKHAHVSDPGPLGFRCVDTVHVEHLATDQASSCTRPFCSSADELGCGASRTRPDHDHREYRATVTRSDSDNRRRAAPPGEVRAGFGGTDWWPQRVPTIRLMLGAHSV
jgi:hypothetical protein